MALLSIAEPGQSQAPHQHRLAIGIDLGTTNSLVAAVRDGSAQVLRDEDGMKLLPSVVRYLPGGDVQIGIEARSGQLVDPLNTVASVKRWMGRGLADIPDAQRRAYRLIGGRGMVEVETIAGTRSPVQISAEVLKVLRHARRAGARRRTRGRSDHGAGLFRRCAASGDQGCRAARGAQCLAAAQRADRGRDRLRT